MTEQDLDAAYTALCNGLAEAGEPRAQRFLAMLCMALLVEFDSAQEVLPLIESVRQRCLQD